MRLRGGRSVLRGCPAEISVVESTVLIWVVEPMVLIWVVEPFRERIPCPRVSACLPADIPRDLPPGGYLGFGVRAKRY